MKFVFFKKTIKKKIFSMVLIYILLSFFMLSNNSFALTSDTEIDSLLYCNNDIIMDLESGNILYEKNAYDKVFPASTTKVLTALLAIENLNLSDTVIASKNAVYSTPVGSSVIYLKAEEAMSVENLLYGLLIHSGNDAANVLAEAVSGDIPSFITLMNNKLEKIGCTNTHFTNAHGFHDKNHYTTVFDMAKLFRYALNNETFKKIVSTKEITIPKTNKSEERTYKNTNKMFNEKYKDMYYEYVVGGKTGYTEEARGTFVGFGTKDDKTVIVCAFDGSQNISGNEGRFLDSITLFEYAFNNFNKYKLIDKNNFTFDISDETYNKKYTVSIQNDTYALYNNDFNFARYNINLIENELENFNINDKVGTIEITNKGNSINVSNTYDLVLVSKTSYFNFYLSSKWIKIILFIISSIFLILIISANKPMKKKRKKKALKKVNRNLYNR